MPADLVVIGGGVAGIHTVNLLARRLGPDEARIHLVDRHGVHVFQPGLLRLSLGRTEARRLVRDVRRLVPDHVELHIDEAVRLDPVARVVHLERFGALRFDHLVLATGARVDRESLPGFRVGANDFYTLPAAQRLREALRNFDGGELVVGVTSVPYKCPPAPVEFALLVDEELRRRGVRKRTRITFLSPIERAFPIEGASRLIEPTFEARDIALARFANVEEIDVDKRQVVTLEGETFDYDLAVLVPPHAGSVLVDNSGLGDREGWVPTEPETLRALGFTTVHVVGDATDLPVSKTGSTAHFEAPVVAERIVASLREVEPDPQVATFDGRVVCVLDMGGRKGTVITYDYEHPADPPEPSLRWWLVKRAFERAYWAAIRGAAGTRVDRWTERLVGG
jgi:sulfide:quinone oxidoreductase